MTSTANMKKILRALQPKRPRGRPTKKPWTDIDTRRAFLVVYIIGEHPGKFQNRREAISHLQILAGVIRRTPLEGMDAHSKRAYEDFAATFRLAVLEQSVSRGFAKCKPLKVIEKEIAKKSGRFYRK